MLVDVAIPKTKFDFLTYEADESTAAGDLVLVPLRRKDLQGIVVRTNVRRDVRGLRNIKKIVQPGFLEAPLIKLYEWIAEYYMGTLGEVLTLALPADVLGMEITDSAGVVPRPAAAAGRQKDFVLTDQQQQALNAIKNALKKEKFNAFLLWGVTGSGKTEVYIRAVQEVLGQGGRVLVLVPEISMTPLLLDRFAERFGSQVVTIHSSLTANTRRTLWHRIKNGFYQVVIGPRSSIFLPIPDLKVIIVDEEHDQSYKEHQRTVRYNARDTAVMRGSIEGISVVLGSATPQIETFHNAATGKYQLLKLENRIDNRPMPMIEVVDVRDEHHRYISDRLEQKLAETVSSQGQVILFLNRRGYAPNLICPNCGFIAQCPHCRLPMVSHRGAGPGRASYLSCHTCDHRSRLVSVCPRCGRKTLLYKGAGTQRVEELVRRLIGRLPRQPDDTPYSAVRMDRDSVRKRGEADRILHTVGSGEAQILIGTQLVTKGLDFPEVTLVGVINADTVLNLPDFRSGERTFQLLTQVAGRAGRGDKPGTVLVQTFHPEQYSIIFGRLQNYPYFYDQEMQLRKELEFPPFTRLILLRLKGKKEERVWQEARRIYERVRNIPGVKIFGPNNSYYYRIRDEFRVFILLKVFSRFDRKRIEFLREIDINGAVLEIDVDPLDIC
jgi:primosomal protein N' (replication factor Y)